MNLSITEALVAQLVEQDGVDATNAVTLLRNAQRAVMEDCNVSELGLYQSREEDEVDSIITFATRNGRTNIFFE
jgi:hypothetical protein